MPAVGYLPEETVPAVGYLPEETVPAVGYLPEFQQRQLREERRNKHM